MDASVVIGGYFYERRFVTEASIDDIHYLT